MLNNLQHEPIRFASRSVAEAFVNRAVVTYMIVLGDDQNFWVVCPSDAERLIKAGYEVSL